MKSAPRLRQVHKRSAALAAAFLAGLWFLAARPAPLLVLTYHRVTDAASGPVPAVRPADFARQLDYLRRAGYRSIGPEELHAHMTGTGRLPPRAVLITFDDGWADNYTEALPLLRARGFVATVFVVSGLVGRRDRLSAGQLRELAAEGWTIGAHTRHHRHLPGLSPAATRLEIHGSRQDLGRLLGRPVTAFAYPYGDFDPAVRAEVAAAGFTTAFGTRLGFPRPGQDPLTIKRLTMPRRGGAVLLGLVGSAWYGPVRLVLEGVAATWPAVKVQEAYARRLWRRPPTRP
ncbi:MAG: polysaccharide deacetylase family protein [Bacteroidota bacterium]